MKLVDADKLIKELTEIAHAGYPMVSVGGVIEMIESATIDDNTLEKLSLSQEMEL